MTWQPIETAPRDGSEILIFEQTATGPMFRVGYWETEGTDVHDASHNEGWSLADDGYIGCIEPTHWMPLPNPPAQAGEAGTAETVEQGSVHEHAAGNADAPKGDA